MPRKTSCSWQTTGERVLGVACGTAGTIINRQTRRKSVSCSTVPHLPETQGSDELRHVRNNYVYCFDLGSIILSFDFFMCVHYHKPPNKNELSVSCSSLTGNTSNWRALPRPEQLCSSLLSRSIFVVCQLSTIINNQTRRKPGCIVVPHLPETKVTK